MADRIQSTRRIFEGLYVLNFGLVASYVVDAGDRLVAFDSGMGPKGVVSEMRKLGLDPDRVQSVFLTHSDWDHAGGLAAFPHAKTLLSEDEVAMMNRTTPRFFGRIYNHPLPSPYETLADGQELRLGNLLVRCISTPGHTAGSMSFLVNGAILIVGDELNLKRGRAVLDRNFLAIDNAKRLESIRKLAKLRDVRIICPAHSGYSDDFANAMSDWQTTGGE